MLFVVVLGIAILIAACSGGGGGGAPRIDGYTVSGTVADSAGNGLKDVTVTFSDVTDTVQTDAKGMWTSPELKGEVTVTPIHDDYNFTPGSMKVTQTRDDVNFTAEKTAVPDPDSKYAVSGTIKDNDGNALQDVKVTFSGVTDTVKTDAKGTWTSPDVKGEVTVSPVHDDYNFTPKNIKVTKGRDDVNFTAEKKTVAPQPGPTLKVEANITEIEPEEKVTVSATIGGTDASGVDIAWAATAADNSVAGVFDDNSSASGDSVMWTAPDVAGAYTITATATIEGESLSGSVYITVKSSGDNGDPGEPHERLKIEIDGAPNSMLGGRTVDLNADVTGTFAEDAKVTWTVSGGQLNRTAGNNIIWTAPEQTGQFTITATAATEDESDVATVGIGVQFEPLSLEVTFTPEQVAMETIVSLTASVSGTNANTATIAWTSSFAEGLSSLRGSQVEWTAPENQDSYTITATARAGSDTVEQTITIDVGLCATGALDSRHDPCGLFTIAQMGHIRHHLDGHFALIDDIDASEATDWPVIGGLGFPPIGSIDNPFTGSFNGRGNTIHNLQVIFPDNEYVGLFGYVGQDARVENVNIDGANVKGKKYVGILAGFARDAEIDMVTTSGSVESEQGFVGGVVGVNQDRGSVKRSSSSSEVTSPMTGGADRVGGLVGWNVGDIVNGEATGVTVVGETFVGGLVGHNVGTVRDSSADNNSETEGIQHVGGLAGLNVGSISSTTSSGNVTGQNMVGGLVGTNDTTGTIMRSSVGLVTKTILSRKGFAGGLVGLNEEGATIEESYAAGLFARVKASNAVVGGLVGSNIGNITRSYSYGLTIEGNTAGGLAGHNDGQIYETYSINSLADGPTVGGLVDYGSPNNVSRSYWAVVGDEINRSGGGTRKTVSQMKRQSTYEGWSTHYWDFSGMYPTLVNTP